MIKTQKKETNDQESSLCQNDICSIQQNFSFFKREVN